MKKKISHIIILLYFFSFMLGCDCREINFKGMTRWEVAEILEKGPKRKDGSFRVCHSLQDSPSNTLVNHFYKNKDSLLKSKDAMNSVVWRVFFHEDGCTWHSYLIEFKDNVVVAQESRSQPHWTMAEP